MIVPVTGPTSTQIDLSNTSLKDLNSSGYNSGTNQIGTSVKESDCEN